MKNVVIKVTDLTKIYNNKVLANDKINLEIYEGEIFGLLGPNGAGKTTFVKQLLGLLLPTKGDIKINNIDVVKYPEKLKPIINYLGQNPYALWHLTVEEAIFYTGILKKVKDDEAKKRTEDLIKDLRLQNFRKLYLGQLSGGILRIVNFAQAIVSDCKILILDEPTAGLDPINKKMIWDKIFELHNKNNITTILVTHDVLEAEKVLQRVGFIKNSKIIALGTVGELKKDVDDRFRIELKINPSCELNLQKLNSFGEIIEIHKNHFYILPPKSDAFRNLENIIKEFGYSLIDDIRLTTPSLEDVYIKLAGEKID